MKDIKISIIIAVYNDSDHIKAAIESVLTQSFKDIEVIVVDDGSTDNIKEVLNPYIISGYIKYLYQKNTGQSIARFNAINHSKGEYIAFLDSDDEWIDQDKLQKQVELFNKNKSLVLVGTAGSAISEDKSLICDYRVPKNDFDIRNKILFKNPFIQSSVLIKRDVIERLGPPKIVDHSKAEDYYMWLSIGCVGKIANINEPMVRYLVRRNNTSSKNKKNILKNNIDIIKEFKSNYPNYKLAIIFAYLKFFIFSVINVFPPSLKEIISRHMFKIYRKI